MRLRNSFITVSLAVGCVQSVQSGAVRCDTAQQCPSGLVCRQADLLCVASGQLGSTSGAGINSASSGGSSTSGSSTSGGASSGSVTTGSAATSSTTGCVRFSSAYQTAVLAEGSHLVAYYRLDETSGTAMADSSPHHFAGSYGSRVALGQPGLVASDAATSPHFAGGPWTDAGIAEAPPLAQLNGATAFSVELFLNEDAVNFGDGGSDGYIDVVNYGIYPKAAFGIQLMPTNQVKLYLPLSSNPDVSAISPSPLIPGQTFQIDATYDGLTAAIYSNGILVASTVDAGTPRFAGVGSVGLGIGSTAAFDNGRPVFQGSIAQVSLYDTALTAQRIAAHYQATQLDGGCAP